VTAVHSAFYSPHMFDPRPLGTLLAGMPSSTSKPGGWIATEWPYDKIQNRLEEAYGMSNLGAESVSGGLRGKHHAYARQRQQNFALEGLINEAAALAKTDPIQFRIDHTTEQRLIDLLNADCQGSRMGASTFAAPRRSQNRNSAVTGSWRVDHGPPETPTGWNRRGRGCSSDRSGAGDEVHDWCRLRQDH